MQPLADCINPSRLESGITSGSHDITEHTFDSTPSNQKQHHIIRREIHREKDLHISAPQYLTSFAYLLSRIQIGYCNCRCFFENFWELHLLHRTTAQLLSKYSHWPEEVWTRSGNSREAAACSDSYLAYLEFEGSSPKFTRYNGPMEFVAHFDMVPTHEKILCLLKCWPGLSLKDQIPDVYTYVQWDHLCKVHKNDCENAEMTGQSGNINRAMFSRVHLGL